MIIIFKMAGPNVLHLPSTVEIEIPEDGQIRIADLKRKIALMLFESGSIPINLENMSISSKGNLINSPDGWLNLTSEMIYDVQAYHGLCDPITFEPLEGAVVYPQIAAKQVYFYNRATFNRLVRNNLDPMTQNPIEKTIEIQLPNPDKPDSDVTAFSEMIKSDAFKADYEDAFQEWYHELLAQEEVAAQPERPESKKEKEGKESFYKRLSESGMLYANLKELEQNKNSFNATSYVLVGEYDQLYKVYKVEIERRDGKSSTVRFIELSDDSEEIQNDRLPLLRKVKNKEQQDEYEENNFSVKTTGSMKQQLEQTRKRPVSPPASTLARQEQRGWFASLFYRPPQIITPSVAATSAPPGRTQHLVKASVFFDGEVPERFKVLLLGDKQVGKSKLILKFAEGLYTESHIYSLGVSHKTKNIDMNGDRYRVYAYDQPKEHSQNPAESFVMQPHAVIICYNPSDIDSRTNVDQWVKEITRFSDCTIVIAETQHDRDFSEYKARFQKHKTVDQNRDRIKAYAESQNIPYVNTSAKTGEGVNSLFKKTIEDHLEKKSIKKPIYG